MYSPLQGTLGDAVTEDPRLGLKQETFWRLQSQVRVLAESVSGADPVPGSQTAVDLVCPHLGVPFIRALSNPQRLHLQMPSHARFQCMNWGWEGHSHSVYGRWVVDRTIALFSVFITV